MLLGKSGRELVMSKLDLEKAEEPEIKLPNLLGHRESKGIPEKKSTSVSSATLKPLTVWIITSSGKLLKRWEVSIRELGAIAVIRSHLAPSAVPGVYLSPAASGLGPGSVRAPTNI